MKEDMNTRLLLVIATQLQLHNSVMLSGKSLTIDKVLDEHREVLEKLCKAFKND